MREPPEPSTADPRPAKPVVVTIDKHALGRMIVRACPENGGEDCLAHSVPPAALQLELTLLGLPLRRAHDLAERALCGEVVSHPLNVSYEKWQEICTTWLRRARPAFLSDHK